MKPKVAITKGNAYTATKKVLELTDFKKMLKGKSKIVIKPNLVVAKKASEGITTDVNIVRAILDQIPSNKKISIVEGSQVATTSFKFNGYLDLEDEYDVDIIDANLSEYVEVKVKNPVIFKTIKISKVVFNSDFLISVGKLKIHSVAGVTLSLKNMMGVCPRSQKLKIHFYIPESFIDMLSILMPDFGVIDGIVGNEIDELKPYPVKVGVILASKDCVALDCVASEIMGIKPLKVPYISEIAKREFGIANMDEIEIVGEKIENVRKVFRRISFFKNYFRVITVRLLIKLGLFDSFFKYIYSRFI